MQAIKQVAVSGVGIVSPAAVGGRKILSVLGKSSPVDWLTLFDPPGKCEHAAEVVEDYDWKQYLLSSQHYASRATMLAAGAARLALDEAGLQLPLAAGGDCGICLGTRWGCLDSAQKFYEPVMAGQGRRASAQVFSHSYPNSIASMLAIEFGLGGYSNIFAGSSAGGMQALFSAALAVASGTASMMLAGGVDALSPLAIAHGESTGEYADTAGREIDFNDPTNRELAEKVPGEAAVFVMLQPLEDCSGGQLCVLPSSIARNNPPTMDANGLGMGNCGAAGALLSFIRGLS